MGWFIARRPRVSAMPHHARETGSAHCRTMPRATRSPPCPAPTIPPLPPARTGWLLAWALFWLLMLTVAVQDHLRTSTGALWKPVLWEGTSFVAATALLALMWRHSSRHDELLARPWRWFALHLRWLPLLAPGFVITIYAMRHAVFAALGQTYHHPGWGEVFLYECTKFSIFYALFVAVAFGLRIHAGAGRPAPADPGRPAGPADPAVAAALPVQRAEHHRRDDPHRARSRRLVAHPPGRAAARDNRPDTPAAVHARRGARAARRLRRDHVRTIRRSGHAAPRGRPRGAGLSRADLVDPAACSRTRSGTAWNVAAGAPIWWCVRCAATLACASRSSKARAARPRHRLTGSDWTRCASVWLRCTARARRWASSR